MRTLSFIALCLSMGCQGKPTFKTPDFIVKESTTRHYDRMENTPFVWTDGRLLTMVNPYPLDLIEIYDGGTLLHSHSTELNLSSAIVVGSRLYVFGYNQNTGSIDFIYTDDLITWSTPTTALAPVSGRQYFNNSVAQLPDGTFIMAYETCEAGTVCFNTRFAWSSDLSTWHEAAGLFSPDRYAACPTIRFIDGMYYMFILRSVGEGNFVTFIARSHDLNTWEESLIPVLAASGDEGVNNSDMDLVEHQGQVIISYATGDQLTWDHIKFARYDGTLASFVKEFFK